MSTITILDVYKIIMTSSVNPFSRTSERWWKRHFRRYIIELSEKIKKLQKEKVINLKELSDIQFKIKACKEWLKTFSIAPMPKLRDVQLDVVEDIIEKNHLRTFYQKKIYNLKQNMEEVRNKRGKKIVYDVKTLSDTCDELLKRRIA